MQTKMKSLALMLTLALGMPAISQAAPLLADQGEPAAKLARVPQANAWLEIDKQALPIISALCKKNWMANPKSAR